MSNTHDGTGNKLYYYRRIPWRGHISRIQPLCQLFRSRKRDDVFTDQLNIHAKRAIVRSDGSTLRVFIFRIFPFYSRKCNKIVFAMRFLNGRARERRRNYKNGVLINIHCRRRRRRSSRKMY